MLDIYSQEFLVSKSQMRISKIQEKTLKQRKKTKKLSFNLFLHSRFILAESYRSTKHHISRRILKNLMFESSDAAEITKPDWPKDLQGDALERKRRRRRHRRLVKQARIGVHPEIHRLLQETSGVWKRRDNVSREGHRDVVQESVAVIVASWPT